MTKLRAAVIENILRHLDVTEFGPIGFVTDFPEKGDGLCTITFSADEKYQLKIEENRSSRITITQSPGSYKKIEYSQADDLDEAIALIVPWSKRIKEDLSASSRTQENISDIAEKIDQYLKEKVSEPDIRFTTAEVESLRERLAVLEEKFIELQETSQITKTELSNLKKATQNASQDVGIYTKRVWYKISMGKVLSTVRAISLSKEGREIISGLIKKQIGLD